MFSLKGALFKLLGGHGEVYDLLALTYGLFSGFMHVIIAGWVNIFSGGENPMGNLVVLCGLLLAGTRL